MSGSNLSIDQLLDILERVPSTSAFHTKAAQLLDEHLVKRESPPIPEATPRGPARKLTIGMATYDDFDGVYFSVQAICLYHPEVTEQTEILVIDNHPDGPAAAALKDLERSVQNYRYVPAGFAQGTAVRDLVFREAAGEFVLCMDSHVMFPAGVLARLIDYFGQHPDTKDLLQGPIVYDDLRKIATHFDPIWQAGMWGVWAHDHRGDDPNGEPFEIPMQGLGVFACRRDAWVGLNPRLRGFGGEEGCLHEKFRQSGGKTLCLPFLRWIHRFGRPMGTRYALDWESRIRNYLILFQELGLDRAPILQHFTQHLGAEAANAAVAAAEREITNPFSFFEAIYCINLDRATDRWAEMQARFEALGIAGRVRRFPAIETPSNHHIGCALSHRAILAEARQRGLDNVLVFEDDAIFSGAALEELRLNLDELRSRPWKTLYLGGHRWGKSFPKAPGCSHLEIPKGVTCTHAIAYHHSVFDRILPDIPASPSGVALWLRKYRGIDQYLANQLDGEHLITSPVIASQTSILGQESRSFGA